MTVIDTAKRKTEGGFYLIRIKINGRIETIKPVFADSKTESRIFGREIAKQAGGQFLIAVKLKIGK